MRLQKLIARHLYLEAESVTLWTTDCGNAALVSVAHLKSAELTAYHQAKLSLLPVMNICIVYSCRYHCLY